MFCIGPGGKPENVKGGWHGVYIYIYTYIYIYVYIYIYIEREGLFVIESLCVVHRPGRQG